MPYLKNIFFSKLKLINFYDILILTILVIFARIIHSSLIDMNAPIGNISSLSIPLGIENLPEYSIRTMLRMLIAVLFSLLFTFIYGSLAAKTSLGLVLVPLLNILQSVPILGYISFTVTLFLSVFPGSSLGIEAASIFAIFTSQVWNMIFSYYQSLKNIPTELKEISQIQKMSSWQKFCRLELPYAMPNLLLNTILSMSAGWVFVVASEAILVGSNDFLLPGIGSYISTAIEAKNIESIFYAIIAMSLVIIFYNQFLFKPLTIYASKFKCENSTSVTIQRSWLIELFHKTSFLKIINAYIINLWKLFLRKTFLISKLISFKFPSFITKMLYLIAIIFITSKFIELCSYIYFEIDPSEIIKVIKLGSFTATRVLILIILASIIWIPIGIYVGLRKNLATNISPIIQFFAAWPVNLLFPVAVILISKYNLNKNIWLSLLMILGTQWYILFNVMAGALAFPDDLKEVLSNYKIKGKLWAIKIILPFIFPYYMTGVITAAGGCWNASIISEIVSWGNTDISTPGIGTYISMATTEGNMNHIAIGISVMCIYVFLFNKYLWDPLFKLAENKIKL